MATEPAVPPVPPLPPEDHRCARCRFDYGATGVQEALAGIRQLPDSARALVAAVPAPALHRRPREGTWSITEYVCHLRDVHVTATIRLHRARTEDRPVLEPMLNDLRARRFRYNARDVRPVLDELADVVAGCCDEAARFGAADWDRVVTRLPGEERTARWLLRHARHEGIHHLGDLRDVAAAVVP